MYDVTVIGCGICGASIAYALSHYDLRVLVLEKENDIAEGATKANSGIVHAGYDPLPGTLMAKLNCEGAAKMASLCKEFGISYTQCGSMVLAFDEKEDEMVRELLARGKENGVSHLSILSGDSVREAEPLVSMEVTSALFAPTAAVILPWELCLAFMRNAMNNGVTLMRNQEVQSISSAPLDHYIIQTASDTFASRYVVNAAGIQSDRIHNMVSSPDFEILPSRGEYALFDKNNHTPVKHVLFQCPSALGKGVLVAPTVHGNLIVGPSSTQTQDRENLSTTTSVQDSVQAHARKTLPSICFRDNIRNFAGLRANSSAHDFLIRECIDAPRFIDVAGIRSPGLAASPAIGEYVVNLLSFAGLPLTKRAVYENAPIPIRFCDLTDEARADLVTRDPRYGRILCRCETVTEGEILDAIRDILPPASIDAIKRRCGAGLGRCQGGFCGPKILMLLSRELGLDPTDILQDMTGSYILSSRTKEETDEAL